MVATPLILAVDDMQVNRELISAALASNFEVLTAESAQEALTILENKHPDLIVLDVNMPEMDGYELCRHLKKDKKTTDIPVVFLSGLNTLEDRLKGYDAGGADYICKPFEVAELEEKIKRQLEWKHTHGALKERLASATSTAMTAMSNSSELGAVMTFIEHSFSCDSYDDLAHAIITAMNFFGLRVDIQIRAGDSNHNYSTSGAQVHPMVVELLTRAADAATVVNAEEKTFYNAPPVSFLVHNTPVDDAGKAGRLRDHLAIMLKGAEARVTFLHQQKTQAEERQAYVKEVLSSTHGDLQTIESLFKAFGKTSKEVMDQLTQEMEAKLLLLALSEEEENSLLQVIREGIERLDTLYDRGAEVDSCLSHMNKELNKLMTGT